MKGTVNNGNGRPRPRVTKSNFRIVEFVNPSSQQVYRVTGWKLDGERVRENFKTHAEAVARKQKLDIENANLETAGQTVFTRLTPAEVNDAENALALVKRAGLPSLSFAADFCVRNYRDPLKRITTSDAVTKFVAEKESAKRRERYLKDLRQELGYLTARFGKRLVHEVQKDDLVSVIDAPDRGAERQNNIRKDYRTFFNWCMANGFAQANPAELVVQKTVERGEIKVLSLTEAQALMKAAVTFKRGKLVPYVALGMFCAIRPDELARLSWDQIDLEEKQVTITASAAKKRGRRVVDMPENCLAWLKDHEKARKPIKGNNWRRDFDELRMRIGYGNPAQKSASELQREKRKHLKPWPQDVLRHTGISCHYRKHEDEAKTATWAGNSADMIHGHYRALVSAKEAAGLFEIWPKGVKAVKTKQPKNVVAMPKAGAA